jgi:transcriptional pleiotropic regulator of transition state genes
MAGHSIGVMKPTGIRRKVDDLGRVVIPATMRRSLGIGVGDEVEISVDEGRLVLAKPAEQCTFCGTDQDLGAFRGKVVCWSCTAALRALDREHADESASPFF